MMHMKVRLHHNQEDFGIEENCFVMHDKFYFDGLSGHGGRKQRCRIRYGSDGCRSKLRSESAITWELAWNIFEEKGLV